MRKTRKKRRNKKKFWYKKAFIIGVFVVVVFLSGSKRPIERVMEKNSGYNRDTNG